MATNQCKCSSDIRTFERRIWWLSLIVYERWLEVAHTLGLRSTPYDYRQGGAMECDGLTPIGMFVETLAAKI